MESPIHYGWPVCFALILASAGFAFFQLERMPEIDVRIGPSLKVRSGQGSQKTVQDAAIGPELKRGDTLLSIAGQRIAQLEDAKTILGYVVGDQTPVQFVRPTHRFTVELTGEEDPSSLPAGVQPNDTLIAVDGRNLPGRVRIEGLRSIIASRPQAVLGFERTDALFRSELKLERPASRYSFLALFILSLGFALLLWARRHQDLPRAFSVWVSFETIAVAWVALLVFAYQWVIADKVMASICIVATVFARPLAALSWNVVRGRPASGPLFGLGVALVAAATLATLGFIDQIDLELALQGASIFAVLFLTYELVLTRVDPQGSSFGDRVGYLTGVLALVAVAAASAYFADSSAFVERRWVWFVVVMLGLVWFADIVYALRGPLATGIAAISGKEERLQVLAEYFDSLATATEGMTPTLAVMYEDESANLHMRHGRLSVKRNDRSMHDALVILTDEQVEIPMPDGDRGTHPMSGIAHTMKMAAAAEIAPPQYALTLPNQRIVFLAFHTGKKTNAPSYASTDTVDLARTEVSELVWSAALMEAMPLLMRGGQSSDAVEELRRELKRAEGAAQRLQSELDSAAQRSDLLQKDRVELGAFISFFSEQTRQPVAQSFSEIARLVEPGLIESIEYLLEDDAPIVIGGAFGVGKRFTGLFAHEIDGRYPGPLALMDASEFVDALGVVSAFPPPTMDAVVGGGLLVQNAGLLTDEFLSELVEASKQTFRLILCYTDDHAEEETVLREIPDDLALVLEERELVLPSFVSRSSIKREVLQHLLERAALAQRKSIVGFSRDAWIELETYDFRGNIAEAKLRIERAVAIAKGEVVERDEIF